MPETTHEISDALLQENLPREERKRLYHQIGERALHWWTRRETFRAERIRNRDYYRGHQYNQLIKNDNGEWVTEKQFIEDQNRIVVVMNMVSNIINNIHGQFLQNRSERAAFAIERQAEEQVKAMNLARRYMRRLSRSHVIESEQSREHFLSGASCFRDTIRWYPQLNRHEVFDAVVPQPRLFFNLDIEDSRLTGLNLIGQLHDAGRSQIYQQFARSKRDQRRIDGLLENDGSHFPDGLTEYGFDDINALGFYQPVDPAQHRVIEIWTETYQWVRFGYDPLFQLTDGYEELTLPDNQIARIQNARREAGLPLLELDEKKYEPFWYRLFLNNQFEPFTDPAPTPYWHGGHPYTLGLAMLVDGETWGIVTNIRDPQRLINRLFAQIDHSMGVGAKGALGIDQDLLDESRQSPEEILDNYSRADGLVTMPLRGRTWDQAIRQFQQAPLSGGHFQMIPLAMTFTEKISGLPEAAQGFTPKAGTPAALYDRQVRQASVNAMPYLQSYFDTLHEKDVKHLQLVQQAIAERRTFAGSSQGEEVVYDPETVRDIRMDVAIGEIEDTTTHREQQEAFWLNLVQAGAMPLEIYLTLSSNPRAQEALSLLSQLGQLAVTNTEGVPI